ncbi:MAG TPA: hypothetical protein VNW29_02920 [Candidatus Sulfotelmatobacter sp.]|jgi:hypothetical protein|nr:hypothetical protein [Candidatus Sulfotelmatobacter sp.]
MSSSFGSRELAACLLCLGFKEASQTGSRHLKYSSPNPVEKGKRSFITLLQGKACYDSIICRKYIKQIMALGFTKEQISKCKIS